MQHAKEAKEDTLNIKRQSEIYGNGIWYTGSGGQDLMLEKHWNNSVKTGMPIAWDMKTKDPVSKAKVYGYHDSVASVHAALKETPIGKRCAYEILTANTPCHPYLDIEFLVRSEGGRHQTDPDHGKLIMILEKVKGNFKEAYGIDAYFMVLIGSRPDDKEGDWFKYSYHAIMTNITMQNNTDSGLKQLLQRGMEVDIDDEAKKTSMFYCQDYKHIYDKKKEFKHIVDWGVYSNKRVMRMLGCSKRGSSVPFMKLVDVRYADYFDCSPVVDAITPTLDEFYQSLILQPLSEVTPFLPGFDVPSFAGGSGAAAGGSGAAAGGSGAAAGYNNGTRPAATMVRPGELPFDVEEVVRALRSAGDDVSVFSNVKRFERKTPDEAGGWQVQFKKSTERPCVVECGRTHGSNNVVVMVYEVANSNMSRFRVIAKCFGDGCNGRTCMIGMIGGLAAAKRAARSRSPAEGGARRRDDDGVVINEAEEDARRSLFNQPREPLLAEGGTGVDSDPEDDMQISGDDEDDGDVLLRGEYLDSENTYPIVKARFEKRYFQLDSGGYVKIGWGVKTPIYMTATQMKDNNQNIFCSIYDKKTKEMMKVVFVSKWMKDPNIRKLYGVDFDPTCTVKRIYNTWPGFLVERLPPIEDKSTIPTLVQPIMYHIDVVIADGDVALATWFRHWMAHLLQLPQTKTGKAVSLYGSQGAGKTILVQWMAEALMGEGGNGPASITNDAVTDVVGRFATSLVGKVFCMIEEAVDMKIHAEKLKDIINGGVLRAEVKGRTKVTAKNYSNLVCTSNTDDMLPIESDDRRYVLIKVSDKHLGDKKYFTALRAHIARPEVQRAFYEYCLGVDLSIYTDGFQNADISTAFYRRMRELNLSPFIRFLGALVKLPCYTEGKEPFHATTHGIMAMLTSYLKHNGLEAKNKITGVIPLGHKLAEFKSITSKKANATVSVVDGRCARSHNAERMDNRVRGWTFDIGALKAELIKSNRFVEDDHTVLL
jgi:hypothetical protein